MLARNYLPIRVSRSHRWIIVWSLPNQYIKVVIALRGGCQVPLAHDSGLVTRPLQQFWKGLLATVKDDPVDHESIQVTVLSRLYDCPTRTANGIGNVAPIEFHALVGNAIHIRSVSYTHLTLPTNREV